MVRQSNGTARMVTAFACWLALLAVGPATAQSISVQEISPFVLGLIPVVRNGAVGGVSVDAAGVLSRAEEDASGRLRQAWLAALAPIDSDLAAASPLRKISLRRLMAEIEARRQAGDRLSDDVLLLAGLQGIRHVFVYPDAQDIVLAGPAGGWTVAEDGTIVGAAGGRPVLRLADLVVALRAADGPVGGAMSCSIDPTAEGLRRLRELIARRRGRAAETALAAIERALGPQDITFRGVPPASHFARVMAAADLQMKRLAMGLEAAPIDELPSYLSLLNEGADAGGFSDSTMPRWWLAPDYEPLLHDGDGLAWELRGPRVMALAEGGRLGREGRVAGAAAADPAADRWAETMTGRYEELAAAMPVFAELRGSMDLAVVAALLIHRDLLAVAECDLSLLLTATELDGEEFIAPRQTASVASVSKRDGGTLVAVSGGVDLDVRGLVEEMEVRESLQRDWAAAAPPAADRWWWD